MDEESHPHLRLIDSNKPLNQLSESDLHQYNHDDEEYNYELGMSKRDVKLLVISAALLGILAGVIAVGAFGVIAVLW
jgi:hypothetical protein